MISQPHPCLKLRERVVRLLHPIVAQLTTPPAPPQRPIPIPPAWPFYDVFLNGETTAVVAVEHLPPEVRQYLKEVRASDWKKIRAARCGPTESATLVTLAQALDAIFRRRVGTFEAVCSPDAHEYLRTLHETADALNTLVACVRRLATIRRDGVVTRILSQLPKAHPPKGATAP